MKSKTLIPVRVKMVPGTFIPAISGAVYFRIPLSKKGIVYFRLMQVEKTADPMQLVKNEIYRPKFITPDCSTERIIYNKN